MAIVGTIESAAHTNDKVGTTMPDPIGSAWQARRSVALVLTFVFLCGSFFHGLGAGDLKDWDESLYATRALAIYREGGMAWVDQSPWSR